MKPLVNISKNKVTFRTPEAVHIIAYNEILFCEASIQYTTLYKTDGSSEKIKLSLAEVEQSLTGLSFWATSKNHLVNLKYLDRVPKNEEGIVLLNNFYRIPIDDERKELLVNELTKLQ